MSEKSKISSYLESARDSFDGKPWYGSSVMTILDQVSEEHINWVPEGFQKSIAMLLRHMLSWKEFVILKLQGRADYRIPDESVTNWDLEAVVSMEAWQQLRSELHQKQKELLQHLESMTDLDLEEQVPGSIYSKEYLIRGAIQHDIFHLGQIAMLMRALT